MGLTVDMIRGRLTNVVGSPSFFLQVHISHVIGTLKACYFLHVLNVSFDSFCVLFQDVNFLTDLSILCIRPGKFELTFNSSIFILGLVLTYVNTVSM